jgi:hypothetical protein
VSAAPYLSLVVTARNDDHGGNLLGRMQAFVNNWLNQARRFAIPSELIIVEWNPPPDRPRLAQALHWPEEPGPCAVRIVEVPPQVHARYANAKALPLYQMIGKNVGIRRARGQFVLATNIDILFSSELAAFLAEQRLDPHRLYRIDRYDVMSDVPVDADPEEQLAYCRSHLIRINRREGTFSVSGVDLAGISGGEIAREAPGLEFGHGWYAMERYGQQEPFRWAAAQAELAVARPPAAASALVLEVEPGPAAGRSPLDLEILVADQSLGRFHLARRSRLEIAADWTPAMQIAFRMHGAPAPALHDNRELVFRIFRARWQPGAPAKRPHARLRRFSLLRRAAVVGSAFNHLVVKLAREAPLVNLTVLVSPAWQRILRAYVQRALPHHGPPQGPPKPDPVSPAELHTNSCGDFTMLSRDRWFELRAYPEFDSFSMNLDSVFCFTAHHGGAPEEVLPDPMRIYHIEHGSGSGWTPEGQIKLYQRIAALGLPYLDNDTVLAWAEAMRRLDSPMIFNREDWGLSGVELPETER